ncbi:coiled-coil domain-containing protein 6-like [Tubulanus polymorphus]|uniref:coiled-coil domain-containing protein 6-like n=1 Tax=Tubulanus polymorphus TaxID=672921 RepID=UPI003DA3F029
MADSTSELESDTSSIDGGPVLKLPSSADSEHLHKRIESLQQENRVLKMELDTYKLKCKTLQEENRELRRASVTIQARAEQEEEFISNTLLKKIQKLKKEKETLAMNYEQEEEFLTNDLSRKLMQLRQEKVELEQSLEKEQEYQVNKLMRKIEKLEAEIVGKQSTLEQLRREKVELENALEQEQEALVNRLWKKMEKLEAEKRMLQEKLDQPVSAPASPHDINNGGNKADNLTQHIQNLRGEVHQLKNLLVEAQTENEEKMAHLIHEERQIREENLRLQRKLQMEIDRREALCRHLSESESSLEMDDERHFNEMTKQQDQPVNKESTVVRPRTVSSPIPYASPNPSRPLSPGLNYGSAFSPPGQMRCPNCGQIIYHSSPSTYLPSTSPPVHSCMSNISRPRPVSMSAAQEKFVKPAVPGDRLGKT